MLSGRVWNSHVVQHRRKYWVNTGNGSWKSHASMLEIHLLKSPFMPFLCIVSQRMSVGFMELIASSQGLGQVRTKWIQFLETQEEKFFWSRRAWLRPCNDFNGHTVRTCRLCTLKALASLSLALHCREGVALLASENLDSEFGSHSHGYYWSLENRHVDLIWLKEFVFLSWIVGFDLYLLNGVWINLSFQISFLFYTTLNFFS